MTLLSYIRSFFTSWRERRLLLRRPPWRRDVPDLVQAEMHQMRERHVQARLGRDPSKRSYILKDNKKS